MFLVFYFIVFRHESKKRKAIESLHESLKKGDRVITNSGLYGKITRVDDSIVILEIADNVRIRVARRAIGGPEDTDQADQGRK